MIRSVAAVAVCCVTLACGPAQAQDDVAAFYAGKRVALQVGSAAGTGYDIIARVIVRFMPRHIPGTPTMIVQNMAGAGSIRLATSLLNVGPHDGTAFGLAINGLPTAPLLQPDAAKFDPATFNWIGSTNREIQVTTVWHTAPVQKWEDAKKTELTMGSSGNNSTPSFYGRLLNEVLGLKLKIIVGYESQTHAFLAMEREEINGYPSVFYNSLGHHADIVESEPCLTIMRRGFGWAARG